MSDQFSLKSVLQSNSIMHKVKPGRSLNCTHKVHTWSLFDVADNILRWHHSQSRVVTSLRWNSNIHKSFHEMLGCSGGGSGGWQLIGPSLWLEIKNKALTSSEAWTWRPGEEGGLDTRGQNCSCNCLNACGLLCWPLRPPKVGAAQVNRGRWSWCCGEALLIRCHVSWFFCIWSVYSGTIFSPRKKINPNKVQRC